MSALLGRAGHSTMEPTSDEEQIDREERQGGMPPSVPSALVEQTERPHRDGNPSRSDHDNEEEDASSSPGFDASPSTGFLVGASTQVEQEATTRPDPIGPGDEEFETFHRSFTIGTTTMDTLGARTPYAPPPDPNSGADSASPTATPPPTPLSPALLGPEDSHRPEDQETPEKEPSLPSPDKEDPTVVQARRSMMRRTGDRHARGKLPEPREGRFLPPDCLPLEPQVPAPRSSKRYTMKKRRPPDVVEGKERHDDKKPLEEDEHLVHCHRCDLDIIAMKASVVVRCKSCNKVNPTSSMDSFGLSQFSPS